MVSKIEQEKERADQYDEFLNGIDSDLRATDEYWKQYHEKKRNPMIGFTQLLLWEDVEFKNTPLYLQRSGMYDPSTDNRAQFKNKFSAEHDKILMWG